MGKKVMLTPPKSIRKETKDSSLSRLPPVKRGNHMVNPIMIPKTAPKLSTK